MIKKLFGWLFRPWLLVFIGLLALSLVIWIVGPLVSIGSLRPLDPVWARLTLIGLIVAAYALSKLIKTLRARRRNAHVVDQLMRSDAAAAPSEHAEVAELRKNFERALATLKNARFGAKGGGWSSLSWKFGQQYLYELPWYVIVGAPGAGKTTALLNSGLRFPLADQLGKGAVKGVGGTRNCDWWFTDSAVLIDTAGRYTTHEADPEGDRKAWEGFLGLLKKARPRRPLNGVLWTISVTDLLAQTAEQRHQYAASIRARIQELQSTLGVRFPVYLLVTKCDLLAGFMDYFADADKTERAQPWGMTFDYAASASDQALNGFAGQFDKLTQRLLDGVIDRAQAERDPQRRARIYGFPQQFGGMRDALDDVLRQATTGSNFTVAPLLRSVFFISGTQEGTPIDRMLGMASRQLRLGQSVIPPNQNSGRGFFIARPLTEVVFHEAELAGVNLGWERRRAAIGMAAYASVAVVALGLAALWTTSYVNNRKYVAQTAEQLAQAKALVEQTPNRASAELVPLLPAFNAMKVMVDLTSSQLRPAMHGFGLFQGDRLRAGLHQSYERMLADAFSPRLALRAEDTLRAGGDSELLYEALKTYVMLNNPERFDADAFKLYITADWEANLAPTVTPEERAALETHLNALVAARTVTSPLAEDKALVARVRTQLASVPLAQRVYSRLRRQGVGEDIPVFTVGRAGGPSAPSVFTRASGLPLTRGVPGLFSYRGYHEGLQKSVTRVTKQLAEEEEWVLGVTDNKARWSDSMALTRLTNDVRRLYLNDYARTWEAFLGDIKLVRATSLAQLTQLTRILSAPDNPLVPLMTRASMETTLLASTRKSLLGQATDTAQGTIERSRKELEAILRSRPQGTADSALDAPERIVDDRFTKLRAMVSSVDGKQPPPIAASITALNDAYVFLNAADTAIRTGSQPPPSDVPNKLRSMGPQSPEPLKSMLEGLSAASSNATLLAVRGTLGPLVNTTIGDFCRQAAAGRYPLARNSQRDITQDDFARLFAPNGLFDDFFRKNLLSMVDVSTRPWSFRTSGGDSVKADDAGLAQFQRAAVIRDTFFRAGGPQPALRLDFKPIEMDANISQFSLDVDGQVVRYAHGPQIPASIQWPGPRGSSQVRLMLSPPSAGGASGVTTDGPWALFRMFDRMQIETTGIPERFRVVFNVDGRKATFEVTASSVQNPFRLREMAEFNCPTNL